MLKCPYEGEIKELRNINIKKRFLKSSLELRFNVAFATIPHNNMTKTYYFNCIVKLIFFVHCRAVHDSASSVNNNISRRIIRL